MTNQFETVHGVVLAAGAAARFGSPKQLAMLGEETLLERSVRAVQTVANPVYVVHGAARLLTVPLMAKWQTVPVYNPQWSMGMASSIRLALEELAGHLQPQDGVLLCVCDQPHLNSALLGQLLQLAANHPSGVAAAQYAGAMGTPVALSARHVQPLLDQLRTQAEQDRGAGPYLKQLADFARIDFPEGELDVDTQDDLRRAEASLKAPV